MVANESYLTLSVRSKCCNQEVTCFHLKVYFFFHFNLTFHLLLLLHLITFVISLYLASPGFHLSLLTFSLSFFISPHSYSHLTCSLIFLSCEPPSLSRWILNCLSMLLTFTLDSSSHLWRSAKKIHHITSDLNALTKCSLSVNLTRPLASWWNFCHSLKLLSLFTLHLNLSPPAKTIIILDKVKCAPWHFIRHFYLPSLLRANLFHLL